MKNISKKIVYSLVSFLAIPLMMIGFLTEFWSLDASGTAISSSKLKVFDEIPRLFIDSFSISNNNYQGIWRTLLLIAVAFSAVVLGVYLIFTIIDLFASNKNTKLVRRISSYTLLAFSVLILVFALLFINLNVLTTFIANKTIGFKPEQGFYGMILAPAVAGIFGLLATNKNKKSKK